ncbi:hypothetical protein MRX96_004763 [Rhipicephalus microplus]
MSSSTIGVHIRKAQPADCEALKKLMKGAEEFDFRDDTTAMTDLKENAFGEWPLVNILVAEDGSGGKSTVAASSSIHRSCMYTHADAIANGRMARRITYVQASAFPAPPLCSSLMPSPPLVGCALYSLVFSTWGGKSMVLDGVHVAPAYRGKGVGSALLRSIFKEAAHNKCNELSCHVSAKNEAFINLMRRHGGMDQEREKGWHLFSMDSRAITMMTQEQPWTPARTASDTSKKSM